MTPMAPKARIPFLPCQLTGHPREGDRDLRLDGWEGSRHSHSPSRERQGSAKPCFILVLPALLFATLHERRLFSLASQDEGYGSPLGGAGPTVRHQTSYCVLHLTA